MNVVFKFVTLFRYEFFTAREIIRNAVKGYVSTISANAKVTQNVMSINILFSLRKHFILEPQLCACTDEPLESLTACTFCFSTLLEFFVPRTYRRSDGFRIRLSCRPCEHCKRSRASICSSCTASRWKLVVA